MPNYLIYSRHLLRIHGKSIIWNQSHLKLSQAAISVNNVEKTRARLLYQSKKRGILENDIILGSFAEEHLAKMNESELKAYDMLINGDHMEWDLYYYLSGKKTPPSQLIECSMFQQLKRHVDEKRVKK